MNPIDDQLQRLLEAAARAPQAEIGRPPYGLETRVLASWRAGEPASFWERGLLIRGLLLATVLMGLSLWPVLQNTSDPFADYLQLADSTSPADLTP